MLLTFFAAFAGFVFAQTSTSVTTTKKTSETTIVNPVPAATPPKTTRIYTPKPFPTPARRIIARPGINTSGIPAEKSIKVDAKANIQLCVASGNLKVNGWNRNEVRAIVENGSYVGFKVLNKNTQNEPAVVKILGYDPMKVAASAVNNCLLGENIEIDVPRGATLDIEGRTVETEISSVSKVQVKGNSGNIVLNDIAQGIDAATYEGDVRVENSSGEIKLSTINGNILAFNVKPIEFSNTFFAKTHSGAIKLQSVEYPQIDTKSISGSIDFSGKILSNGQYKFDSQNGSILLSIPQNSSFGVTASYGIGNFQSEITMTNVIKTPGQPQKLTGKIGTGDATLQLVTFNGAINIKKKEQ